MTRGATSGPVSDPPPGRFWMAMVVFGWPALLVAWGILAALSVPGFVEGGVPFIFLLVAWAPTVFLLRHRIRRSGVLGRPVVE